MKHKMKQLAAAFLIAVALVICARPEPVSARPVTPNNLYFYKWYKSDFSSFGVRFTTKQWVDGVQYRLALTNGKTVETFFWYADSYFYKGTQLTMKFLNYDNDRVLVCYVRTFRYSSAGKKVYSAWSNPAFVTPSPRKNKVKSSLVSSKSTNVKLKWSQIKGSHGYNIYVTTNPSGKWYWNQSTRASSTATSAVIKKYRGKKLKANTRYYVRVAARRKRNGVYCTVMFPSKSFWNCSFKLSK